MTNNSVALSVNLNKIALIRNARTGDNPNIVDYGERCLLAGAAGLTVHPRPDQRHIRPEDCHQLKQLISNKKYDNAKLEFNIEGNPAALKTPATRKDFIDYPGFLEIVEQCVPDQATLVPDDDAQLTSDHGFDLSHDTDRLEKTIARIKQLGVRTSLFMDPDIEQISRARDIGADRIELYTGPFAKAYASGIKDSAQRLFDLHCQAAEHANSIGLGVNAGHDLNLDNLQLYRQLPYLTEVSIGHALTIDALHFGLNDTVSRYIKILETVS